MIKSILIPALVLTASCAAFGQEVVGYGAVAKTYREPRAILLPGNQISVENKGRVFIDMPGKMPSIDRIDPLMPIIVPPRDLYSKFPVKILSRYFPSNMPIKILKDKVIRNSDRTIRDEK